MHQRSRSDRPWMHMTVFVDYAYGFHAVPAMAAASDLVAEGVIISNSYVPDSPAGPTTDYVFDVSNVIANHKGDAIPRQISLHEHGGPQLPDNIEVKNALEYHDGDHVIVFLRQVSPGRYTSIAGPQSAFNVENGLVSAHHPDQQVTNFTGPMPLDDFIELVGQ
ncbi:MAG TPA: hypothetical protein VFI42_00700 [Thermomicrobiaceae bacterium]|nr:hypothetical protein [Thermomicrobiaceae bacterium]